MECNECMGISNMGLGAKDCKCSHNQRLNDPSKHGGAFGHSIE
jgi:hypothetical protein